MIYLGFLHSRFFAFFQSIIVAETRAGLHLGCILMGRKALYMPGLKSSEISLELSGDAAKLPHLEPARAYSGLVPVPMRHAPAALSAYRLRSSIGRAIDAIPKCADEELAYGGRMLFAPVALGFGAAA